MPVSLYVFQVEGTILTHTMEGSMELKITYPDSVIAARKFSISVLVENKGWEDKQDISFTITNSDGTIIPLATNEILIEKLSTKGSYGATLDFVVSPNTSDGFHYLNAIYSQVLIENNEKPREPTKNNIAIPILIKEKPSVVINTKTPETIFPNAEFSFQIDLLSEDIDIDNVNVQIIPPRNIEFIGDSMYTFSSIEKDVPISIKSQIKTPQEEIINEHKIPFQIIVTYTNDEGNEITDSKTVSLLMRPRTFMELTTEGGIWLGSFFIAPYISVGTIVGIPAGAILSIIIMRSQKKSKKKKIKK
jgi:hypothetical protein